MKIGIKLDDIVDIKEFSKIVNFVSEDITDYEYIEDSSELILNCSSKADVESITEDIIKLSKKYKTSGIASKELFHSEDNKKCYKNMSDYQEVCYKIGNGFVVLKGVALFLFNFFDKEFTEMAIKLGAVSRQYPVLLPVDDYKKTGYLHNSPQYATFCCDASENISKLEELEKNIDSKDIFQRLQKPYYALSPSACFHTYMEYQNKILDKMTVLTFRQSVFRNEGRLNYREIGRLRDYHVREIVFLGDNTFVTQKRDEAIQYSIELLEEWGMTGKIISASDPFVMPKMQKYKKIQLLENSKYEIRLNVSDNDQISTASFNLHGTAFSSPFKISVSEVDEAVTGCVGFGLERWVIAFLSQFGADSDNWPKPIKEKWDITNESIY